GRRLSGQRGPRRAAQPRHRVVVSLRLLLARPQPQAARVGGAHGRGTLRQAGTRRIILSGRPAGVPDVPLRLSGRWLDAGRDAAREGELAKHKIAVIPGDGIGKEVVPEGLRVLDVAGRRFKVELQLDHFDWSCDYYLKHGTMMPENWKEQIGKHDAIFFGAVGWPAKVPDHVSLWGLLIKFRRDFDQYVNLRPCRLMPGVRAPLVDRKPGDIDFFVASNLFGDILSDLGPACTGTIAIAPSGNINPERAFPSLFEPVHGSAPDIYGKGIANPIGQIWAAAMMLEHLGHPEAGAAVVRAIETVLDPTSGAPRTPDLGGKDKTADLGKAIADAL